MDISRSQHIPVLLEEIVKFLDVAPNDIVVDGTLGLGGHARELLRGIGDDGRYVAFDWDQRNLHEARRRLKKFEGKIQFINDSFDRIDHYSKVLRLPHVSKVLLDLGLSSPHLDVAEFGFSYNKRGPLDMRFSKDKKLSASLIVNKASFEKLREILSRLGEVPSSSKVASIIIEERDKSPFTYTDEFAERIAKAFAPDKRNKNMAQVFQALRIAVNDELNVLHNALHNYFDLLEKGGRMAVISYHSLEDRIVKNFFKDLFRPLETDPERALYSVHGEPLAEFVGKSVMEASDEELDINPRSRSAKLRIIQKL